ncbi:peptidoglycan-associated lipoprotein Pal [Piscinibacter sakaiensis]|uniref:peptidoglycan-associated lipoprotein Pal n=1 Tax=Piscinibacter sakaiensis TaxID=1547922 RepID=UPI00372A1304
MMTKSTLSLAALAAAALLAGCSSPVKLDTPAPVETRTPGMPIASVDLSKSGAAGAAGNLQRTVYFDFDSFVVKDDYRPVVESNAKALSADRTRKVSVEGHTDERGSREYNLALGQKRAEAVTRAMALLGANDSQMEAVSFGKERPAVSGSGEEAWAKNRRAEIVSR